MNIFIEKLKNVFTTRRQLGNDDLVILNAIKEELQYPILDFVYNTPAYTHLIMYGGTLLRIAYKLSRLSEDLDFQTAKSFNMKQFTEDLTLYFQKTYDIDIEVKINKEKATGTDSAYIKFPGILEEIGLKGHGIWTKIQIRFDINNFAEAENFSTEQIPITKDAYTFLIRTYPISTLMASKISAVLLRGKRGIGNEISDCKPRDIYDLLWYMQQKIIPDLDYLKAIYARRQIKMEARSILELFGLLVRHVANLDDKTFAKDLIRFFDNPLEFEDWHRNWRERFLMLRNTYEIFEVGDLEEIFIGLDPSTDHRRINFLFETSTNKRVKFSCNLSEYWYIFPEFQISADHRRIKFENLIKSGRKLSELELSYIGLFYTKIEDYLKRNGHVVLQPELKTKLIRASAENLNVKTEVFLDRRLLLKEKFEDLL